MRAAVQVCTLALCRSPFLAVALLSSCISNADSKPADLQATLVATNPNEDAADLKTIAELKASGSNITKPADMRHYLFVPTAGAAADAAKALRALRYRTETAPPDAGGTSKYASYYEIRASITAVPSIGTVRAARAVFTKLAAAYGGIYLGWKARIVR